MVVDLLLTPGVRLRERHGLNRGGHASSEEAPLAATHADQQGRDAMLQKQLEVAQTELEEQVAEGGREDFCRKIIAYYQDRVLTPEECKAVAPNLEPKLGVNRILKLKRIEHLRNEISLLKKV